MPPRAQRLYPRMRERPPEFRINHAWPLYDKLLMLFAPSPAWRCMRFGIVNELLYQHQTSSFAIQYYPEIARYAITGALQAVNHLEGSSVPDRTLFSPTTMFCWVMPIQENSSWSDLPPVAHATGLGTYWGHRITLYNANNIRSRIFHAAISSNSSNFLLARSATQIPLLRWSTLAFTWNGIVPSGLQLFTNGRYDLDTYPYQTLNQDQPITARYSVCGGSEDTYTSRGWYWALTDCMVLSVAVPESVIVALSDPYNVDLRINSTPLILPPRRRLWPVAPVAEYLKRRQFGLRAGSREAVT